MGQESDRSPLRIAVLGLGTVAQGVLQILQANAGTLAARAGRRLQVTGIASRRMRDEVELGDVPFSTDLGALAVDSDVDVLVECIGGEQPALELVEAALRAGKHVVTANKALIALHGDRLHALAAEHSALLAYEAAVAGGIPILGGLVTGLAANQTQWLAGIINGTSNFILTAMAQDGQDFATALAQAQELGYAEADPTFDVEGIDAAHKLAILVALGFDTRFQFDQIFVEGISEVSAEDIEYAERLGYRIKHLGIARSRADGVEARVHPALVPQDQILAQIDGVTNAVMVSGDAVGVTAYVGPGAGKLPTASAVVADLVALAAGTLPTRSAATQDVSILGIEQAVCPYYLRIPCLDEPGVFAKVATELSRCDISIESVIQREQAVQVDAGRPWVPVVLVTHAVAEGALRDAVARIRALP
ncbi:MAG: homoserine dehydrogenase, partial [Pseudomonadales bacterium]